MASQELRTQLVFEAADVLRNCEALSESLNKIARLNFGQLSQGFRQMSNNVRMAQNRISEMSTKTVNDASRRIQTYRKQIEILKKEYEQYASFFNIPHISVKQEQKIRELARLNAELANIYRSTGQAEKGLTHLREAIEQAEIVRQVSGRTDFKRRYEEQYRELAEYVARRNREMANLDAQIPFTKEWDRARKKQQTEQNIENRAVAREKAEQLATEAALLRIKREEDRIKQQIAAREEKDAAKKAARLREIDELMQKLDAAENKINTRFKNKKPFDNDELIKTGNLIQNLVNQIDRLAGTKISKFTASFLSDLNKINNAVKKEIAQDKAAEEAKRNLAQAESLMRSAKKAQLRLEDQLQNSKKPFTDAKMGEIITQFYNRMKDINKLDPNANVTRDFDAFLNRLIALNQIKQREKELNEERQKALALAKQLEDANRKAEAAAQRAQAEQLKAERDAITAARRKEAELRKIQNLNDQLILQETKIRERLQGEKPFKDSELLKIEQTFRNLANDLDRLTGSNMSKLIDPFMNIIRGQNFNLIDKLADDAKQTKQQKDAAKEAEEATKAAERQARAEKKAEDEKVNRYERIARLAGRIAEIQAKINERFDKGKPFSEKEFVRLRNQLHNIGVELDHLTGKNVSGYISYQKSGVKPLALAMGI